jgi:aspartate aminotransferase
MPISYELSRQLDKIKASPTLALASQAAELKKQGKKIIDLTTGEPDFDTPEHIKTAAKKALDLGQTKYTAVDGTPALKNAIIQKLKRDNQLDYAPAEIIVSNGAKHSIFAAYAAILNPGDEVLIPVPAWVSYMDMAILFDAKPVLVNTEAKNAFKLTAAELEAAITPKTKILLLNTPSNPTGMSYRASELKALGEVLRKHPHVLIISDDIYEHILWTTEPFVNLINVCPDLKDRTLVINGVSKAYAMTGFRIGFTAGPTPIINNMKKHQSQSTSNPCSISQAAAVEAFAGSQAEVQVMKAAYKARHDYFIPALDAVGFKTQPCDGAFYAFCDVRDLIKKKGLKDCHEFAAYLLEKAEIAGVPGSAFGYGGYIRFSYATDMKNLEEAIERLKSF